MGLRREGEQDSRNGNILLSRNRLSGSLPDAGDHLRMLMLNDNRLSGDLGKALKRAEGIHTLDVSHNEFHGHIADVIAGKPELRHLSVSHNKITEGGPRGTARAALGAARHLKSYDISHNKLFMHDSADDASLFHAHHYQADPARVRFIRHWNTIRMKFLI